MSAGTGPGRDDAIPDPNPDPGTGVSGEVRHARAYSGEAHGTRWTTKADQDLPAEVNGDVPGRHNVPAGPRPPPRRRPQRQGALGGHQPKPGTRAPLP